MLKVGVIGIGNAGNQVVAYADSTLKVPVLALNASEKDLSTLPDGIKKIKLTKLADGTGKDRNLAKQYLKTSISALLSSEDLVAFQNVDVIFVVGSCGGGTGSGIAPVLTTILGKMFPDASVILVGILPSVQEAYSTQVNALEYMNELYSSMEGQTYMLYDNGRYDDLPSPVMMQKVNQEIVEDIKVISGIYNLPTKFSSIDENDMRRIINLKGRIVVARVEDIKEKDLDNQTIDDLIIKTIKTNAHAEIQRDQTVTSTGIIINLSENINNGFNSHVKKVQEFVGSPIYEFEHIVLNTDRKIRNDVFYIMSGLTKVNDRILKISDRIDEIEALQKKRDEEEDMISGVDIASLTDKINDKKETKGDGNLDINSVWSQFNM